jgi:multidrug transporter EmrE-like cation transporter
MAYVLLVMALLLNAAANTLLKLGASRLQEVSDAGLIERVLGNPWLLLGLLLFAINVGCYVAALSQLRLSIAYPVMAAGSLLVVVLSSVLWLGEALTTVQWSGIALLLAGIVLVTARSAT